MVEGEGVALYLQCWKVKEESYTLIKTRRCEKTGGWEEVAVEVQIPAGTSAITFEVYSPVSTRGVFDFDDVEFALFEVREEVHWSGGQ